MEQLPNQTKVPTICSQGEVEDDVQSKAVSHNKGDGIKAECPGA